MKIKNINELTQFLDGFQELFLLAKTNSTAYRAEILESDQYFHKGSGKNVFIELNCHPGFHDLCGEDGFQANKKKVEEYFKKNDGLYEGLMQDFDGIRAAASRWYASHGEFVNRQYVIDNLINLTALKSIIVISEVDAKPFINHMCEFIDRYVNLQQSPKVFAKLLNKNINKQRDYYLYAKKVAFDNLESLMSTNNLQIYRDTILNDANLVNAISNVTLNISNPVTSGSNDLSKIRKAITDLTYAYILEYKTARSDASRLFDLTLKSKPSGSLVFFKKQKASHLDFIDKLFSDDKKMAKQIKDHLKQGYTLTIVAMVKHMKIICSALPTVPTELTTFLRDFLTISIDDNYSRNKRLKDCYTNFSKKASFDDYVTRKANLIFIALLEMDAGVSLYGAERRQSFSN